MRVVRFQNTENMDEKFCFIFVLFYLYSVCLVSGQSECTGEECEFYFYWLTLLDVNESSLFDFRFVEVEKRSLKMCIRVKNFPLNEN